MNNIYQKNTLSLLKAVYLASLFLWLLTGYSSINAQNSGNPVLLPKTYEIDSVIITAGKESRNLMEKPYTEPNSLLPSISKVSHGDIRKQCATNVVEAMNHIPGGLIETRGRQVKQFFSVRGQKYPYPDYAINGVWQKEFEELPYFFSTSDIEEIEIVRSSAALLTGLSGLGGLINIKTREYSSPETNLEMEYGSLNSLHTHLSNGNKIGRFSYAAGIGYDKSDGPSGKHAKEEMADLYSQVHWQPTDKLSIKANLFYLDGKRELRVAELPADQKYRDMVQNFDPYKVVLSNLKMVYRPGEKFSSELQLFYSYRNPTFNDEVNATSSNEKDSEWGLNFIQSVSVTKLNILRFGGLYNHWVAPNGKRFYTGKRCDIETFSGVLVDEQRIGPVTLDAGIRWTKTYLNDYGAFNIEGDGVQFKKVDPIEDQWEPAILQSSLGASYRINNWLSLYLNSAAGQIKPRQGSLNIDLSEPLNETRYKIDVGAIRKIGSSGKITLTAFGVMQKNAIALSGDTYLNTLTNIRRELYLNRDQNQFGLEFEIVAPKMFNFMEPFLNFTVMKSSMKEDGSLVINKENPVLIASGGLYMNKNNFDLNLLSKYVSPFENDRFASVTDGPQPLGDFLTIDLSGGYTTKGQVPVRLYIKMRNLTNKKYSTVIGYPDFGRMIFSGVQVKFLREKNQKK
ncbi:MAG: TonB-dependent receptor [Bacteroidia bacterium]|nr:TonB-dependent receptor [Bacteroidia bacterium]